MMGILEKALQGENIDFLSPKYGIIPKIVNENGRRKWTSVVGNK